MAAKNNGKAPVEDLVRSQVIQSGNCAASTTAYNDGLESLESSILTAGDVDGLDAKSFMTLNESGIPTFSPSWPKQQTDQRWSVLKCSCGKSGGSVMPSEYYSGQSVTTFDIYYSVPMYVCEDCQKPESCHE